MRLNGGHDVLIALGSLGARGWEVVPMDTDLLPGMEMDAARSGMEAVTREARTDDTMRRWTIVALVLVVATAAVAAVAHGLDLLWWLRR